MKQSSFCWPVRWHRLCSVPRDCAKGEDKSGDGNTKQQILRLEHEGREATLKTLAANDRLLADNWININNDGSLRPSEAVGTAEGRLV